MPNYAIGDIQGCYQKFLQLLQLIKYDSNQDRLLLTGDLVNRGPQSLEVLRFLKNLPKQPIIVLGNHDLHLLAVAYKQTAIKNSDTFQDILAAPDCLALCDWLREQNLAYQDKNLGYFMVHAGLPPIWSLNQAKKYAKEVEAVLRGNNFLDYLGNLYGDLPNQWDNNLKGSDRWRLITNYLTRLRFCDKNGQLELKNKTASKNHSEFLPWFEFASKWPAQQKILFGHWAALEGKTNKPNIFALDTGCVWGNCLTALRLEDQQRFSVPCSNGL